MNTLADYRKKFYASSEKASDVSRQLAFAGIAVVWVFRVEDAGKLAIPTQLLLPSLLFCLALGLDLLHSVSSTLTWGAYSRHKEKQGMRDTDQFDHPTILNWPALLFFFSKVLAIAAGYALLLCYLWTLVRLV